MKKYFCYFDGLRNNTYFQVRPYNPNSEVKLSITACQGLTNVIDVSLTKEELDELIDELIQHRNNF